MTTYLDEDERVLFDMLQSLVFLVYFVANFLVAIAYLTGDVYFDPKLDYFLHRFSAPGRISLPVCVMLMILGSPIVCIYVIRILWQMIIEPCPMGIGCDRTECPVCLRVRSKFLQSVCLMCDHYICRTCIQMLCYTQPSTACCPLCRELIYRRECSVDSNIIIL
ncbi:hypothetical protein F8203_gp125 [Heliothis virescens ascovirus 3f]|uniref:RING-type domain-containing protein n=1 Tax=Heliothis virescens ascovirus 3f TaxID=328614 RepID=A0A171PVM7_9VIRU|nr:hypothetical protein F8203_gp125 [Heliothis virescens ascovirus 3f]AJP09091.1 hypothetical protein [Heliothis virescens ascovirus 3f]